jgi:hypothetical protein
MQAGLDAFGRPVARDDVEVSGDLVDHGRNGGIARVLLSCREERFEEAFLFLDGWLELALWGVVIRVDLPHLPWETF